MSAPLWKWDWDYLIHFAIGAAVTAAVIAGLAFTPVPWWIGGGAMVPIATGIGYLREKKQHPDRLTPHQHAEALLFGIGAAVACGGAALYFVLAAYSLALG